jgi:hypothetical protein
MVVVKTVEEFQEKNENELKAFMRYQTGIYDQEIIKDTLQDFYVRLLQTRALEKFDENRATTEEGNTLNYERWVCNNFCWMLPLLRKKNYTSVLKLLLPKSPEKSTSEKDDSEEDSTYETLRFYSTLPVRKGQKEPPADIYSILNTSKKNSTYSIDERFNVSMVEIEEEQRIKEDLNSFFRYVKRIVSEKKFIQIEKYVQSRIKGLNSVDISILMKISNNMVKFIKQETQEYFKRWMKNRVVV